MSRCARARERSRHLDTRGTIEAYFADLRAGGQWQRRFAGDVVFVSHGAPV